MKKTMMLLPAVVFIVGFNAMTCDCGPERSVREAYVDAAVVFTAAVQSILTEPDPTYPQAERRVVKTSIRQNWKGLNSLSEAYIRTAADSSTCGYRFNIGETYLIYGYVNAEGSFATSYCSRTKPISGAGEEIQELNRIVGRIQ